MVMTHVLLDAVISATGTVLNLVLLYLISAVAARLEPGMRTALFVSCCTDLVQCISTLMTFFSATSGGSVTFLTANNPLVPVEPVLFAQLAISFNAFMIFMTMMGLALQFVCRYGVMRNRPFSPPQLLGLFACTGLYNAAHCGLVFCYDSERTPELDDLLRRALQLDNRTQPPPYVHGSMTNKCMVVQAVDVLVITSYVYIVILTTIFKSGRSMTLTSNTLTTRTQRIQQQLTRVLYIQACYPLFSIFIPAFIFTTVAISGSTVHFVAEASVVMVHTTAAVNPCLVLCGMSTLRHRLWARARALVRMSKVSAKSASTLDRSTSKFGAQ